MICNDVDMINNNSPSLLSLDGVRERKRKGEMKRFKARSYYRLLNHAEAN